MTIDQDLEPAADEPAPDDPAQSLAPPQVPPPRRLRRPVLIAGGACIALVALVTGLVVALEHQPASGSQRPSTVASSTPTPTSTVAPADAPLKAVAAQAQLILNRRAKAVVDGDETAFLQDLLPGDPKALAHQKTLFRSLARLGLDTFVTDLVDGEHLSVPAATSRWGEHAWVLPAYTDYEFGYMAQGNNWYVEPFTFVPRDGRWWLASDQLGANQVRNTGDLVPWQLGETWVARGKRSIVIGNAADRSRLPGLARKVDASVATVGKTWKEDRYEGMDQRKVVVMASGSAKVLKALANEDGPPASAVTLSTRADDGTGDLSEADSPAPTGIHIVLNASLKSARDTRTLTHEVTHALLVEREYRGTPTWVTEGVAEYTAYREMSLREVFLKRGTDSRTRSELMAGRYHLTLPASTSFYSGSDTTVGYHYTSAMFLFEYVNHKYGTKKLVRLHDKLATILSEKDSAKLEAAYIRSELGVSRAQLLDDASEWVQSTVDRNFR